MRLLCFGSGGEVIADSNHWGEGDMEWHSAVGLLVLVVKRSLLNLVIALR